MEKINVEELLRNCPKGMELDCTMFDDIKFSHIQNDEAYPIVITILDTYKEVLTAYGTWNDKPNAKCVIFPKGKTSWEGFVPPCKFKDGDIVSTMNGIWIGIVKKPVNSSYETYITINGEYLMYDNPIFCFERLATEEERAKLFKAIKDNGYRWNEETKTLEKLVEPKFKVGDTITNGKTSITIGYIDNEYYYEISRNIANRLYIKYQDEWKLISEKFPIRFNINTLIPFESRVLVRDNVKEKWHPGIWGFYDDNSYNSYPYKLIGDISLYCIPYEGNEHLLGKTDDCDEYFKSWES